MTVLSRTAIYCDLLRLTGTYCYEFSRTNTLAARTKKLNFPFLGSFFSFWNRLITLFKDMFCSRAYLYFLYFELWSDKFLSVVLTDKSNYEFSMKRIFDYRLGSASDVLTDIW